MQKITIFKKQQILSNFCIGFACIANGSFKICFPWFNDCMTFQLKVHFCSSCQPRSLLDGWWEFWLSVQRRLLPSSHSGQAQRHIRKAKVPWWQKQEHEFGPDPYHGPSQVCTLYATKRKVLKNCLPIFPKAKVTSELGEIFQKVASGRSEILVLRRCNEIIGLLLQVCTWAFGEMRFCNEMHQSSFPFSY